MGAAASTSQKAGARGAGQSPPATSMIERTVEGPDGKPHRVMVNMGESPAAWLFARKLLSRRQFEAAEQIRLDWEKAGMGARVTMKWDAAAAPARKSRSGGRASYDHSVAQIGARDRLDGALAAAGPGLVDILWRVACACEGLVTAERSLGWPARAGKLVLGFALDRIADYYRIR